MTNNTHRTREEKQTILNRINTLLKEGKSVAAACKVEGITPGNRYAWQASLKSSGSRRVARPGSIAASATGVDLDVEHPVAFVVGMPRDIQRTLANFYQGFSQN